MSLKASKKTLGDNMKIKILKDKERQLEKELKIVKEEIELYQEKNP